MNLIVNYSEEPQTYFCIIYTVLLCRVSHMVQVTANLIPVNEMAMQEAMVLEGTMSAELEPNFVNRV